MRRLKGALGALIGEETAGSMGTTPRARQGAALVAVLVFGLTVAPRPVLASTITLTPGTSTIAVPLNLSAFPAFPAILLSNTGNLPFSVGTSSGTLQSRVYLIGTTLDFLYIVTDSAGSTDGIDRLALFDFAGFSTAVAYDNFPAGGIIQAKLTSVPTARPSDSISQISLRVADRFGSRL